MELATFVTAAVSAKTEKKVSDSLVLNVGGRLKVELGAEKQLDVVCPVGKTWLATVHVHIVETDV